MTDHDKLHPHAYNTAINPDVMKIQGRQDRIAFTGVTFRNFALQADINRLQMFCDNYLNFVDEEDSCGHYFKPAAPYVTLAVLNYGKMATESENLGWIAQHEVLFSVPVEWYKVNDKGQLIFHDWAFVCPFIFVDNDQSLGVGREVYGWTKVRAWLQPVTTSWTSDPRKPRRVLSMATELFPKLYAGDRQEPRTLIEIAQEAPPSILRSPVNPDDPHNPWWSASRNLRHSVSAMFSAYEAMLGSPLSGYGGVRHIGTLSRMAGRITQNMMAGLPLIRGGFESLSGVRSRSLFNPASPFMNNITLKQFRDAQYPDLACYQALVNSRISVERLSDGGLLGGPNLALGDITGGYRVRVHQYDEQPIVDTLGLKVSDIEHSEHGTPVAVLTPVLPSWMACDLRYDMGTALCWRDRDSVWSVPSGDDPEAQPDSEDTASAPIFPDIPPPAKPAGRANRYNTTRSAAIQDSVGPFHYPDTTMRVLPLMADAGKLREFCEQYLNTLGINTNTSSYDQTENLPEPPADSSEPQLAAFVTEHIDKNCFIPWGNFVYMVITTYGDQIGKMYTDQNNLGQTADREIAFWIPVKWHSPDDNGPGVTCRVAFITPYVFCDSMRHAITEAEVNGRPVLHSRISSNDEHWLKESGPVADEKMLAELKTLLMPALNMGQPAEMKTLADVKEGDVAGYNEDIPWAAIKAKWKPELIDDYERKIKEKSRWTADGAEASWDQIKDMFTRVITDKKPINFICLKQYRATGEINKQCYQALVLVKKRIDTLWDLREMPAKMHVGIHAYPTLPIVKQLGIKVKTVQSTSQTVVPQMEPIRPFFIRASIVEEVGTNLYTRAQGQAWKSWQHDNETIGQPSEKTQHLLRAIEEPKAVIESLLWDSWAGHDTTNPYSEWTLKYSDNFFGREEVDEFLTRDQNFVEYFMRPDNFGMRPVNLQVFHANVRSDDPEEDS